MLQKRKKKGLTILFIKKYILIKFNYKTLSNKFASPKNK